MPAFLRTKLAGVALATVIVAGGCGGWASYGSERRAYMTALFDSEGGTARSLLCPSAKKLITDADQMLRLFRDQVDRLGLDDAPDSWSPLRGSSDAAYTAFEQSSGGTVTLVLPVDTKSGDEPRMCPTTDDVLGRPEA